VNEHLAGHIPGSIVEMEPLGSVLSVRGSEARVGLPAPAIADAGRATVGTFVRIWAGARRVIGMITEVESHGEFGRAADGFGAVAKIDLMGEITRDENGVDRFARGVAAYPAIGDAAGILGREDLALIYSGASGGAISIGSLQHDETIAARVSVDHMLSKHFAVLGSTGVGKSSGVAVILSEILEARPNLRIFLLDGHNEFGRCFGERANVVNASNLKLPFWLFNFEELIDVLFVGRPAVEEEVDILSEHIPVARGMYLMHRLAQERTTVRRADPRRAGYTVDTPVPYMLQDLIHLIDERMGKLENRATRMHYHRLLGRIEGLRADTRYGFMFENANVGGDTMGDILSHLFRLEPNGQPMTVMQVAGLPAEVVDAVVCVVCRLAFDFGMWSDGASPMLFVCEEAHRYAPADKTVGFAPTRRALLRIAKEGRKYGVYLGMVTQRPAELDPTIISQCNTLFAMRMANDRDQALLRSAVTDTVANLLALVPSLGTREVVAFGEGMPLPARLTFKSLPKDRIPRSETFRRSDVEELGENDRAFVRAVIERWRGASGGPKTSIEDFGAPSNSQAEPAAAADNPLSPEPHSPTDYDPPVRQQSSAVAARIDQIRAQILKRGVATATRS
jgi:hypothetical protein